MLREAYNLINVDNIKVYLSVLTMLHLKNSFGFYQTFKKEKRKFKNSINSKWKKSWESKRFTKSNNKSLKY